LTKYMSRNRFNAILAALNYTNPTPPTFKDRFWEVRNLLTAWNNNMNENFIPGWICCLDESMSKWVNQFTCPGFMVVPRKPWPFGNEYHTIACGVSGVMFGIELVEGKDRPPELPGKEFEEKGKTVSLLQRLTYSIWGTGKVVVLDSGFCVLQGLVKLKKVGVFASAMIKKRRYWPKHVPATTIANYFKDKAVGFVDCLSGSLDNVPVAIHCLKEPDYILQMMTTYGTMETFGEEKFRNFDNGDGQMVLKSFKYPEVVRNYYQYRDAVDSHNAARMYPIALEECWKTHHWPNRVFSFLLAVTEVNIKKSLETIFNVPKASQLDFRREFAKELVGNIYLAQEAVVTRNRGLRAVPIAEHTSIMVPIYHTFKNGQLVTCKTKYIQLTCRCGNRSRHYCSCTPGLVVCNNCFPLHVIEATNEEST